MKKTWFLAIFIFVALSACQSQSSDKANVAQAQPASGAYEDLDVDAFKAKMGGTDVVLMDVRTPEEIAKGKIAGALELDYYASNFQEEITKLDKSKTYLVYCRSGNRSGKTCKLMAEQGFTKLYNLAGGYNAWPRE